MGLWNPAESDKVLARPNHRANSTRNVRFDRIDVRAELIKLGDQAAELLPEIKNHLDAKSSLRVFVFMTARVMVAVPVSMTMFVFMFLFVGVRMVVVGFQMNIELDPVDFLAFDARGVQVIAA